ncbi:hypothetical protein JZ751_014058, partial [Albula glossodonta]
MQIRIALFSLIYKKTLKLSSRVLDKISTGELVSLMSAHLNKLDESLGLAHFVWITPLQCILCVGLIWELIEASGFCTLAALTLLAIMQACLSQKMGPHRAKRAKMISKRLKLTSEIVENIHSVKAYGWEEIMETIIRNIRHAAYFYSAFMVIVCAIVPFALSKGIILRRIFTTLSYCMVLRMTLTRQFPNSIQMWYDTIGLINKIEEYLTKEEYRVLEYSLTTTEVELTNVSASWDEGIGQLFEKIKQENKNNGHPHGDAGLFFTNLYVTPVLKNISLHLEKGQMLAVAGSTGSGKSSLLMMILGELVPSEGKVKHSGRVSFSPQTSWIMPGSIRDNILFGLTYDEYRYTSVIKACQLEEPLLGVKWQAYGQSCQQWEAGALCGAGLSCVSLIQRIQYSPSKPPDSPHLLVLPDSEVAGCASQAAQCRLLSDKPRDLALLPGKDKTPLMEGGVTLSGGQRARISLARAVYKDADLYLLDSPFTHLDIVTEKEIFERCFCKLMASKTRVVVTSKLDHLKRADKILLLHKGTCYFYGTFSELQAQRPDFSSLLLGLGSYDSISAERRGSVLTETLRRVSVDEGAGEGVGLEKVQPPIILSTLSADRRFSRALDEEEEAQAERRFSVVPEDEQVEEVLPRGGHMYPHVLGLPHHRRQSVLAFITDAQSRGRREHNQQSFRRRLSVTPQSELASELDIYARRLSSDSVYDISEEVDEQDMEECFADERENVFETTSWSTYFRYVSTNRNLVLTLIFIVVVFAIEVMKFFGLPGSSYCSCRLKIWREEDETTHPNMSSQGTHYAVIVTPTSAYYIIYIYVATSESVLALGFFRGLPLVHTLLTVSKRLHEQMLSAVLRAPMAILNTMKTGRIMNRFTKDMATIDDMLPLILFDMVQLTLIVLGAIFVVSIMRPYIFIAAIPLTIILKLEAEDSAAVLEYMFKARSPIFSHLILSLRGLWTIRAFGRQSYFETLFHKALNTHTATWHLYLSTLRWFLFRIDILFVLFFTAAAFIAVGTNRDKPGEIGIIIVLAMLILGTFQWAVITSITVDGLMRSVERVFKFIDLPSEEPKSTSGSLGKDLVIENPHVHGGWPSRGHMEVSNLSVRYTEAGRDILQKVSFSVEGGQRMGVLGRTGSGKSTLLSALLRLGSTEGDISIDGVSWTAMPLQAWRKAFGVVPQVSYKLDFQLEDGGSVLSNGHKQLVCLASTLQVLRKTLKHSFSNCTVMLSEHRVEPLLECQSFLVSLLLPHLRLTCNVQHLLLPHLRLTCNVQHLLLPHLRLTCNVQHLLLPHLRLTCNVQHLLLPHLRLTCNMQHLLLPHLHLTCNVQHLLLPHPSLTCNMIEGSSVKTYDTIHKLLNNTSHLKQAISHSEKQKLFPHPLPLHRHVSSKRTAQPISSLQEEAEEEVQDTR